MDDEKRTTQTKKNKPLEEEEGEEKEAPILGDTLEKILSGVSLVDLLSASLVSRAWNLAASSSLRHVTPPKPWLIVHSQSSRPPFPARTSAYDPRSGDWFHILPRRTDSPILTNQILQTSHSNLLFSLSPTGLLFSTDALGLRFSRAAVASASSSRKDPVVARVNRRVVIIGGACVLGDETAATEVYDEVTGAWSACGEMPRFREGSSSATEISVAVDDNRGGVFIAEKSSGMVFAFDPVAMTWRGPYDIRRGGAFCTAMEFSDGGVVAVGLVGDPESVETVILTKFEGESLEEVRALGEMPEEMVERLKGESSHVPSVRVAAKGSFVFLMNPSDPRAVIQCEIGGGGCRWTCVPNKAVDGGDASWIMRRLTFGCADVAMEDLRRAVDSDGVTFVAEGSSLQRARF